MKDFQSNAELLELASTRWRQLCFFPFCLLLQITWISHLFSKENVFTTVNLPSSVMPNRSIGKMLADSYVTHVGKRRTDLGLVSTPLLIPSSISIQKIIVSQCCVLSLEACKLVFRK